MATQTPAVIQNENLHILRGKGIDGGKANVIKPEKKGLKDRKALADLSKAGRPLSSKGVDLKDKPSVRGSQIPKKLPKSSILTDEEIRKCHEWAKEGIEQCHFTGNDARKLEQDIKEERVRKEVDMVMSSLKSWTAMAMTYDFGLPYVPKDTEPVTKLKLEPEIALPKCRSLSISGDEELDDLLPEAELPLHLSVADFPMIELKLKDMAGAMTYD